MSTGILRERTTWMDGSMPSFLLQLVVVLLGSALIACGAHCRVAIGPVPFTLQTFSVYILSFFLSKSLSVYAVLLYLLQGSIGLPCFAAAASGGWYVLGPTGGYLFGFLWLAYAGKHVMDARSRGWLLQSVCLLLLPLPQLLLGTLFLSHYVGDWEAALKVGFWIFVPIEWAKVCLSYLTCHRLRRSLD